MQSKTMPLQDQLNTIIYTSTTPTPLKLPQTSSTPLPSLQLNYYFSKSMSIMFIKISNFKGFKNASDNRQIFYEKCKKRLAL
jgi:hypothetical protein